MGLQMNSHYTSPVWASAGALTVYGVVNRGSPHSPEWTQNHTTNPVSSQEDLQRPSLCHIKSKPECEIFVFYVQRTL